MKTNLWTGTSLTLTAGPMKACMAAAALLAVSGSANAALQANWGAPEVVTILDLDDDMNGTGQATDLRELGYVQQGAYHYFRMAVDAVPSSSTFAEGYMLNFDYQAGGANAGNSYYVASGLVGIDLMVDSHYFQDFKISNHWHAYDSGVVGPLFNTENGLAAPYNVLYNTETIGGQWYQEWAVPLTALVNGNTTVWASTLNPSPDSKTTYDITNPLSFVAVPEPTSMGGGVLLAVGGAGFAFLRRRQPWFKN